MTEMNNNNIANNYDFDAVLNPSSAKRFCKEYFVESVFNFVLAETARKRKVTVEEIQSLRTVLANFTDSSKIVLTRGRDDEKETREYTFSNFMDLYDIRTWMSTAMKLFSSITENSCWYEDCLHNGFCWRNSMGEFCSLTYECEQQEPEADNKNKWGLELDNNEWA
jgi:hypothetical protein